jgi:hypothetical protein
MFLPQAFTDMVRVHYKWDKFYDLCDGAERAPAGFGDAEVRPGHNDI